MFNFRFFLITCLLLCSSIAHVQASCFNDCVVDETGYRLIKQFEGFSPYPYDDVGGIPTIGFGHVIRPGEKVKIPLLGNDAQQLLVNDVNERVPMLNAMIMIPLEHHQFNALASFCYNVGLGALQRSTLLRRVNEARHSEVPAQFMRWNKVGNREYRGLTIRRKAESLIYEGKL